MANGSVEIWAFVMFVWFITDPHHTHVRYPCGFDFLLRIVNHTHLTGKHWAESTVFIHVVEESAAMLAYPVFIIKIPNNPGENVPFIHGFGFNVDFTRGYVGKTWNGKLRADLVNDAIEVLRADFPCANRCLFRRDNVRHFKRVDEFEGGEYSGFQDDVGGMQEVVEARRGVPGICYDCPV